MSRAIHIQGETILADVYTSRNFLHRAATPNDGEVGYAKVNGDTETTLVWNEQFRMWFPPGTAPKATASTPLLGGQRST